MAGGSSPCGKQFASGTSRRKYNFPLAKTFASPHTPRALFAHTISVSNALSLSCSTPLGRPLSTDVNKETSESVPSCDQHPWLKLRKTEVFCMIRVQWSALDARNLKYTAMHQQYHLVQPANTKEKLHIRPWGRFRTARAQRVHSTSYYGVYPGNSPENLPPLEACMSNSKVCVCWHASLDGTPAKCHARWQRAACQPPETVV